MVLFIDLLCFGLELVLVYWPVWFVVLILILFCDDLTLLFLFDVFACLFLLFVVLLCLRVLLAGLLFEVLFVDVVWLV